MQICMLGPNKQGSISKPEHKIWLFQKTTSYCDSKMKIWKVHIYQCMFDINKKLIFNNLGGIQPTECVSFSHTRSFRVKFKFTWLLPLTAFKGQSFTETNDDVRKKKKNPFTTASLKFLIRTCHCLQFHVMGMSLFYTFKLLNTVLSTSVTFANRPLDRLQYGTCYL